jgi:polygalacturonase
MAAPAGMEAEPDILLTAVTARSAVALLASGTACYTLPAPTRWELRRDGRSVASGRSATVAMHLDGLSPGTGYELALPERDAAVRFETAPCAGLVDVTAFGASAGSGDNAAAFAAAIAAVPEGGTLLVPTGRYRTGPVFLKSEMTLLLAEGATLVGVAEREA